MRPVEKDITYLINLKNGDVAAFDKVYALFYRQLCYFALSIVQDKDAAEDLAMESFICLWQKKPDFASLDKLKAYLFTIVHHTGLNQLKTLKRHRSSQRELLYLSQSAENIDLALIRSEALQAIYDEIRNLPPQCRQVVTLTFVEGKSVKDIAEELKLATQTVLNQKNRGIKLLRTALVKNQLLSPAVISIGWTLMSSH